RGTKGGIGQSDTNAAPTGHLTPSKRSCGLMKEYGLAIAASNLRWCRAVKLRHFPLLRRTLLYFAIPGTNTCFGYLRSTPCCSVRIVILRSSPLALLLGSMANVKRY